MSDQKPDGFRSEGQEVADPKPIIEQPKPQAPVVPGTRTEETDTTTTTHVEEETPAPAPAPATEPKE